VEDARVSAVATVPATRSDASGAGTPASPAVAPATNRWLYGPASDLFLGCGLAYALFFLVLVFAGDGVRGVVPYELSPLLALVAGAPHYGATLLRVYERSEDRRAYLFFTLHLTVLVWAVFVACLWSVWIGSIVLTIYLTWSPWHYTGQNYGIALLFLRRRGVRVTPLAKRLIHSSFVLSFLLTAAAIHGAHVGSSYAPVSYESTQYQLIPLRIPAALDEVLFYGLGAAYLASLGAAALLLGREARLRALAPTACVVATQALWFAVPVLARHAGALQGIDPLSASNAGYTFLWIAAAHSVQYLWISSYYARAGGRAPSQTGYYAKALLAGSAIWVMPTLAFAPGLLGTVPYDSGLAVMAAAAVNLHHFLLDGAIWKLRDGRVARILVRSAGASGAAADAAPAAAPSGLRAWPAVAVLGAVSVFVLGYGTIEQEVGVRGALTRGDFPRAEAGIARLGWIGRDGPMIHTAYGLAAAEAGRMEAARSSLERALALHPTAETWRALASVQQRAGDEGGAVRSYLAALEARPGWAEAANDLAWLRATAADAALRDPSDAVRLAESAARATGLRSAPVLDTLAAAYAAALRFPEAVATGERAAALAKQAGDDALATQIEERVAGYRASRPYRASAASTGAPAS
jgi:tetratricopeptide (TPR) repeat protein